MFARPIQLVALFVLASAFAACGGGRSSGSATSPGPSGSGSGGAFHLFSAPETNGNLILAGDGDFYYPAWDPAFANRSSIVQFSPQQVVHSYEIPRNPSLHNAAVVPTDVTLGLDKNIWFGTNDCMIGSVTPSGTFKEYVLKTTGSCTTTVGSSTPGTGLWFTAAFGGMNNFVGYLKNDGQFVTFPITDTGSVSPGQIVLGPDGAFWFTDDTRIGKVTATGHVTYYETNPTMSATGIIVGPDKNLWYCGFGKNAQVGTITTSGHVVAEYAPGAQTFYLTVGSDGNVWGSNSPTAGLVRVTPGGTMTVFNIPNDRGATPRGVAAGPDSNIWFNTFGTKDVQGMGTLILTP